MVKGPVSPLDMRKLYWKGRKIRASICGVDFFICCVTYNLFPFCNIILDTCSEICFISVR